MGAPAKSKVLTGATSYALVWTFFDPVHSCATDRALSWLRSPLSRPGCQALQQNVKWLLEHPLINWLGCFLTPCILVPPFVLFADFWVIVGVHQLSGALAKSKVVTGVPLLSIGLDVF
jgi:hypothetical protein